MLLRSKAFVTRRLKKDDPADAKRLSEQTAVSDELRSPISVLEERLEAQVLASTKLQHDQALLLDELDNLRPLRATLEEREACIKDQRQEISNLQKDLASAETLVAEQLHELELLRPLPEILSLKDKEIHDLSSGVLQRDHHIADQHTELKRLQDELDDIRLVAGGQTATITSLSHEIEQLRPLNEDLRERLAEREDALQGVEQELDGCRASIRKLEGELSASSSQASQRQQELQNTVEDREADIAQLRDDLERAVQSHQQDVRLREDQLSELQGRHGRVSDELDAARVLSQEHESELAQLRPLVEQRRAQDLLVAELRHAISQHEQTGLEQTARIQGLEAEREEVSAQLEAATRAHEEQAATIQRLRDAEAELSALRTRCTQQTVRIIQLESTGRAQKTRIAAQHELISKAQAESSASQTIVEKQRAEIVQLAKLILQQDDYLRAHERRFLKP